jgi:hypothetical protein
MTNLLERAISTDDADRAAKIIQNALGIESDEVADAGLTITSGRRRSNSFWGRGSVEWPSLAHRICLAMQRSKKGGARP